MAILKQINGHTKIGGKGHTAEYLEYGDKTFEGYLTRESRALGIDTFNLVGSDIKNWAEKMDRTRASVRNDRGVGKKKAITYRHYIISPDPKDNVTLEQLRELVDRWVNEEFVEGKFGTYQVAAIYHDDNRERLMQGLNGIPHAHIIVNNTDLYTFKRLRVSDPRVLSDDLQKIAQELGLRYFDGIWNMSKELTDLEYIDSGREKSYRNVSSYSQYYDQRPSQQEVYITKAERELATKGEVSWKEMIRHNIDIACNCCSNISEVHAFLQQAGIEVRPAKKEGSYLYYAPGVDPDGSKANQNLRWYKEEPTKRQEACIAWLQSKGSLPDSVEYTNRKEAADLITQGYEGIGKSVPKSYQYKQAKSNRSAKRVSGERLGRAYTVAGIERQIKQSFYRHLEGDDRNERGVRNMVVEANKVAVNNGEIVALRDISKAFSAIQGANIQTISDAYRKRKLYKSSLAALKSDDPSGKYIQAQLDNVEALIKVAKVTDILPPDEKHAKTMPLNAAARKAQIRNSKASLQEKIKRGWDLTKEEQSKLKPREEREWLRNRHRALAGRKIEPAANKKQRQQGEERRLNQTGDSRHQTR